ALETGHGTMSIILDLDPADPLHASELEQQHFSTKRACPSCGISFPEPDPRLFSYNSKHGWCHSCFGTGVKLTGFDEEQTGEEESWKNLSGEEEHELAACPACHGQRLNRNALAV